MDYALDWPAELMRDELAALMQHPHRGWTGPEVELLLEEAFHTPVPARDFARLHGAAEWSDDPDPTEAWLTDLLRHLKELRPYAPLRLYWTARRYARMTKAAPTAAGRPHHDVHRVYARLIEELHEDGYLAREFAASCVDANPNEHSGRDLHSELTERLGYVIQGRFWPPSRTNGTMNVLRPRRGLSRPRRPPAPSMAARVRRMRIPLR